MNNGKIPFSRIFFLDIETVPMTGKMEEMGFTYQSIGR